MTNVKIKHKPIKLERGNALMLMAIAIVALIGSAGLVVDWGRGVWVKTQLQKAADAGALTGANFLPSQSIAQVKATNSVHSNFDDPDTEQYSVVGNSYTVDLTETVPTLFMLLFGRDTMDITAHSTAEVKIVAGGVNGGGFPFAVINPQLNNDPNDDLVPANYGKKYIIAYGEQNVIIGDWANGSAGLPSVPDGNGQGWRAALGLNQDGTMGNAGASDIVYDIVYGWPGKMKAGDEVPIKTGNMEMPVRKAVNDMLGMNPMKWSEFNPKTGGSSSRVVLVPIIHVVNDARNDTYTVQDWNNGAAWNHEHVIVDGFAPFFVLTEKEQGDVNGDGKSNNDKDWVTGYYIPGVEIPNYLPPNDWSYDFGLYSIPRLTH
ncbi:MAG: Tad domain-containing protein [bacterium]